MNLGRNISYLRKQKKWTQEQFAEEMNVTRQTVSRWESDEITPELSAIIEKGRKDYLEGKCVECKNHEELSSFLDSL